MAYFGIITCPKCGQKVSMTPDEITELSEGFQYYCRRCQINGDLPNDFVFKTPVGRDLNVEEAFVLAKKAKQFSIFGWIKKLFP